MRLGGQVVGAGGGVALLGATFVPWGQRGAGSRIALVRIADLVLAGTVEAWVPRPLGLVVYAIPLGGALLLLGCGLGGRAGGAVAGLGVLAAGSGAAIALVALDRLSAEGTGAGAALAGAGVAAGAVAVVLGLVAEGGGDPAPDPPGPP